MPDTYYALTVTEGGASTAAFYSVTPTSNLTISQGGVTFTPSSASATLVNIYPQTLEISAPAGDMSGGVTIITSDSEVAGRLVVSPPVDVAVVVTLYGNGGIQLGQYIADPGTDGGVFSFPVSDADGIAQRDDAVEVLQTLLAPKPPPSY